MGQQVWGAVRGRGNHALRKRSVGRPAWSSFGVSFLENLLTSLQDDGCFQPLSSSNAIVFSTNWHCSVGFLFTYCYYTTSCSFPPFITLDALCIGHPTFITIVCPFKSGCSAVHHPPIPSSCISAACTPVYLHVRLSVRLHVQMRLEMNPIRCGCCRSSTWMALTNYPHDSVGQLPELAVELEVKCIRYPFSLPLNHFNRRLTDDFTSQQPVIRNLPP